MVRRVISWRWVALRPVSEEAACDLVASTNAFRAAMHDEMRQLSVKHYRIGKITLYERGGAMGYIMCRQEAACSVMWRFQLRASFHVAIDGAGSSAELLSAAATPGWKLLVEVSWDDSVEPFVVHGESSVTTRVIAAWYAHVAVCACVDVYFTCNAACTVCICDFLHLCA